MGRKEEINSQLNKQIRLIVNDFKTLDSYSGRLRLICNQEHFRASFVRIEHPA